MILQLSKVWTNGYDEETRITIGFLRDGGFDNSYPAIVKRVASLWEAECTKIKFVWLAPQVRYQSCDVRISFLAPGGNRPRWYSAIGTDALNNTDQSQPTMHLTWVGDNQAMRQNILHEFGHMLGAQHEHLSPDFLWEWKPANVLAWYETAVRNAARGERPTPRPQEFTRRAQQRANQDMFLRLDRRDLRYSSFDRLSIMMYKIDKTWIRGQYGGNWPRPETLELNYQLSYCDGAIVRAVYGGRPRG